MDGMVYPDDERRELHPYLPWRAASLLDVGCSQGSFGRGLREAGFGGRMVAIEPVGEAANLAEPYYDEVRHGFFPDVVREGESFECITFNDVLEHLVDPWEALRHARRHLAPGGRIVASLPNMRFWPVLKDLVLRGRWDYSDVGVLDRTHLRWFTRASMEELMRADGLMTLVHIEGINKMPAGRLRLLRPVAPAFVDDVTSRQYVCVAVSTTDSAG